MSVLRVVPRYLAVGLTCSGLNIGVLVVGEALRWPLGLSVVVSFVLVCLVGYALHAAVTFSAPASGSGLTRYMLAMAAGLPASSVLLWLFVRALGWRMIIAAPAVTAAMLCFNFLTSRWAVTRPARGAS